MVTDRKRYFKQYQKENRKHINSYMRKYRANHPEYVKKDSKRDRQNRIDRKLKCFSQYSGSSPPKCKCGFENIRALTIDRIDGNHKETTKLYGDDLYRFLIETAYPEGWQVLCMNCQWLKRYDNKELTQPQL